MESVENKLPHELLGKDREIVKVLGEGSFGQVAKCTNLKTNKTEAVKILKSCQGIAKSAYREISNLKRLERLDPDRSHVVRFNSFFFHRDDICLSFELLDVDLRTYIDEINLMSWRRGLALPSVRDITRQLVTALEHLKTIPIIHGDIKPENVMIVDRHQQPLQVKLVDFGGAQLSSQASSENLVHTCSYSSPEVLLKSSVNEATDMWSVGLTVAELALGVKLFGHNDIYNMLRCIINTLGQPPDHVLDNGTNTPSIFNSDPNGVPRWTMKPLDQYKCETNFATARTPDPFRCFDDIRKALLYPRGWQKDLNHFLDLIKNMLEVDPDKRPAPVDVLQHPFLAVKEEEARGITSPEDMQEDAIATLMILMCLLLFSLKMYLLSSTSLMEILGLQ